MDNIFKIEFKKILKKGDFLWEEEKKSLFAKYNIDNEENKNFLLNGYNYIIKKDSKEDKSKFYTYSEFIKYLWLNINFFDDNLVLELKLKLGNFIKNNIFESYSYYLEVLFSINKDDKKYYYEQYNLLEKDNNLYHDINYSFLKIFIKQKNNEYFIKSFQKNIIDNTNEIYFFSIKEWFEYLFSLKKNIFKKHFIELLDFFWNKEIKQKLVKYHEYNSLIRSYDKKDFIEIFKNFSNILDKVKFSLEETVKIKHFLIWDINFAFDNHDRKITENFFINELFKYFYNNDKWFFIELCKKLDSKYIISWLDDLALEFLDENYVEEFIDLFKETENKNLIYITYDLFKREWKEFIVKIFESSSFKDEIKAREKRIEKNNKKYEKEKEDRLKKEKEDFLKMLDPKKGTYYPKFFQDYSNYIEEKSRLKELFTDDEIKEINKSIKKQIKTFFNIIEIENFDDDKISKILTYEKTADNSYRHTWYSSYLSWIMNISKHLKINLSQYYKSYILFYPLLWWSKTTEDILNIIWDNLNPEDIDYILKVYSEDLHENAKGLKYYHTNILTNFYKKFKNKFNSKQKSKLEKICLNIINWEEENNIYYKNDFLEIYSEIWWERKLIKLWNVYKNKFSNYNYFKDFLGSNLNNEEKDEIKFLIFITKELVKTYWNKTSINWSIKQLKYWKIEAVDSHKITYPRTSASFSYISDEESELGQWWKDEFNFSYIFTIIPKVDILDKILEILDTSFKILSDLESWYLKWNYEMYSYYLRRIFYDYIQNLDESLVNKNYYYKVKDLLKKYKPEITYNFNLDLLRKKFLIDDLEEEAKEIIEGEWLEWVKKLLEEKDIIQNSFAEIRTSISSIKNKSDKDYILFVEWITDIIILKNAWEKLRWNSDMPFIIENWYDCHHIWRWFKEENHGFLDSDPDKTFIWMLDYDSAYIKFKDLLKVNNWMNWSILQNDDLKWKIVKHFKKNWYVFVLPVPIDRLNYARTEYWDKSLLSIELLFDDKLLSWFDEKIDLPWLIELNKINDDKKMKFANNTKNFTKDDFKNFEPIFKLIENIISWKYTN